MAGAETQNNKTKPPKRPKRNEIEAMVQTPRALCIGIKIPHLPEDSDYKIPSTPGRQRFQTLRVFQRGDV